MTITQKLISSKVAAAAVGAVVALGLLFTFAVPSQAALTESQIQSILSLLTSFGADASTISNVDASLRGTTPTTPSTPSTSTSCGTFTRDLTVGSTGTDVMDLQKFLNANGAQVAASGAGAPGSESTYFGSLTQAALAKFQTAQGISPAAGYFGPITRAKVSSMCGSTTTTPTTPAPTGTGLAVAAGSQPANSLAPEGASRVPFTRFTVTAGADGAVTVNSVVVQRTGLGSNAAFSGVTLIDQDGNQLGTAKTFNSNDQATIGEAFTVPAGTTKTFTVSGNMATSLDSYAGEAPAISVIAVNTSATVTGSLPITGAYHTLNATLSVGSVSLDVSNANASNSVATKEIGTTAYKASGFRLTAGSAEDVRLMMIRFNQTGSASTLNDLANVKVVVGGTAYATTVSTDGKYVTANFGGGVLITTGNNVEVYVQYDVVGSNASNRTVIFDIDKTTDIYAKGETYGYGISPSTSGGVAVSTLTRSTSNTSETTGTPYIYGAQVTISGASVTTIGKATSVAAQNIARNVPNQPLGGFETDIKGEAITVQSLIFTVSSTSDTLGGPLTNVTIVDENGSVVAGPIDEDSVANGGNGLTFTDSVTFPTGKHTYTIRGKVDSTTTNGATIQLGSTPSSQWTNARGDVTGNSITFTQGLFSMNTMTVKAGSLAVSRAASPASQTVVAGGTSVLMVNFQFDATQSGEDARFSSVPVTLLVSGGTGFYGDPDFLTSCQLYDGSTALNTGSNVLNPSNTGTTSADTDTVTLDNPVSVAKGTVKTLGMRCNVSASVPTASEYVWNTNDAASNMTVTGATSGTTITPSNGSSSAVVVTVSTGSTTVTIDASSPGYKVVSAGSTEVTVGAMKFRASNESLNLTKLGLSLTNSASSSSGDLVKVSIYDGSTKVGEAFFSGSNTTATSTFTSPVVLTKDTDKTLTLKADLASIGTGQAVTFSGHLVAVDYLNAEGTGVESGTTQQLSSAAGSTAVAGVRVMKSFPTVASDTLPSTGIADGRLMRFKVTADSKGPIGITELNFTFATTTATLATVGVYAYEDANYSNPVSGVGTAGLFSPTNALGDAWVSSATNVEFTAFGSASTTLQIPAGGTRYFEVRGTVTGATSGASITTTFKGASAFITSGTAAAATNPLISAAHANFGNEMIWSPNSTTTAVRADEDWTGSYGVSGLPANGLITTRSN